MLVFLLANTLFLREGIKDDGVLLSLRSGEARAVALMAILITLYHLGREVVDIFTWAKENLYIIAAEDLISMLFSLLFFLALGVFCFFVGRFGKRLFPTTVPKEIPEENDFI